jgi:hypothetical protein
MFFFETDPLPPRALLTSTPIPFSDNHTLDAIFFCLRRIPFHLQASLQRLDSFMNVKSVHTSATGRCIICMTSSAIWYLLFVVVTPAPSQAALPQLSASLNQQPASLRLHLSAQESKANVAR